MHLHLYSNTLWPVKTFINRFSEGLNLSYNSLGITSTAICPGYTITNFHTASGVQNEIDRVPSFMKKRPPVLLKRAVVETLKGKKVYVPTLTFKIIVFLLKVMPQSLFWFFSKRLALGDMRKYSLFNSSTITFLSNLLFRHISMI